MPEPDTDADLLRSYPRRIDYQARIIKLLEKRVSQEVRLRGTLCRHIQMLMRRWPELPVQDFEDAMAGDPDDDDDPAA